MIRVRGGRAPDPHHRVANEFVDVTATRLDRLDDDRQVGVGHPHQLGRTDPSGKRGKAGEVGEHDRDLAFFAAEV